MVNCDYARPRPCCACSRTVVSYWGPPVGKMMHPHTGIIHLVREATWRERDVNYISICGLWWVHWWDEKRTELLPIEVSV